MPVLHMSNQIVKSLNPFLADILASGNRTVEPLGKVDCLMVPVEGLSSCERGFPGTLWNGASVVATGASVWTASPC